jgi:iron uptake system EfeUOB component EfeO/EfeM
LLAQSLPPEQLVSIIVRNLNTLADVRASSGEEERYSHSDLNGFAGNAQTARKVVDLLRPMLSKSAADLLPKIDKALAPSIANSTATRSRTATPATTVHQHRNNASRSPTRRKALADALDGIDPALGLSGL